MEVHRGAIQEKEGEETVSLLKDLGVPAFKAGGMPVIDLQRYSLFVGGLVKEERHFFMAGALRHAEEPGKLSADLCLRLVGSSRMGGHPMV